ASAIDCYQVDSRRPENDRDKCVERFVSDPKPKSSRRRVPPGINAIVWIRSTNRMIIIQHVWSSCRPCVSSLTRPISVSSEGRAVGEQQSHAISRSRVQPYMAGSSLGRAVSKCLDAPDLCPERSTGFGKDSAMNDRRARVVV